MLTTRTIDNQDWHMVTNSQGSVLIYTTDGAIAHFVNQFTPKLDPNLRLTVGGDPSTRRNSSKNPVFHHIRRYRY